ncbi:hypothetical protein, partial [Telmatospirillum sp. J64-1]|uniref:hypothetical protein n=1 Tax=Telmatospirillum sp. J64-1 TaxID=2502183 RepID=UPI001C8F8605
AASHASIYLNRLAEAGYLRRLPKRQPSDVPGSQGYVRYQLLLDTGPESPVARKRNGNWEVYDRNTKQVLPCVR